MDASYYDPVALSTIVYGGVQRCYGVVEMQPVPTFTKWFSKLLADRSLTQADASRRLNMGSGRLSEWMTGKVTPSAESCKKIARVFAVDEDEVLVAAGRRTPDPNYDPSAPEAKLLPYLRAIDWDRYPSQLEVIENILKDVLAKQRAAEGTRE